MDLRQGTILVVDDSPLSQTIVSKNLQKLNQKVLIASNGKEAVDLVQKNSFDLIFMDLYMPVMSGYEAIRIIKHILKLPVPIVVMTAFQIDDEKMELKEIGIHEQLSKPIDFSRMTDILVKYLNQKVSLSQINGINDIIIDQIHIEGVNIKEGLSKQNNNLEFYHKLLENFCNHYETFSVQLSDAQKKSTSEFNGLIRGLYTSAEELGLNDIEYHCGQILQFTIDTGSTHLIDILLYDLEAVLSAIHNYLHALYINEHIIINHYRIKEIDILHDMRYYLSRKRPRQVKENCEILKKMATEYDYKALFQLVMEYKYKDAVVFVDQKLLSLKEVHNE